MTALVTTDPRLVALRRDVLDHLPPSAPSTATIAVHSTQRTQSPPLEAELPDLVTSSPGDSTGSSYSEHQFHYILDPHTSMSQSSPPLETLTAESSSAALGRRPSLYYTRAETSYNASSITAPSTIVTVASDASSSTFVPYGRRQTIGDEPVSMYGGSFPYQSGSSTTAFVTRKPTTNKLRKPRTSVIFPVDPNVSFMVDDAQAAGAHFPYQFQSTTTTPASSPNLLSETHPKRSRSLVSSLSFRKKPKPTLQRSSTSAQPPATSAPASQSTLLLPLLRRATTRHSNASASASQLQSISQGRASTFISDPANPNASKGRKLKKARPPPPSFKSPDSQNSGVAQPESTVEKADKGKEKEKRPGTFIRSKSTLSLIARWKRTNSNSEDVATPPLPPLPSPDTTSGATAYYYASLSDTETRGDLRRDHVNDSHDVNGGVSPGEAQKPFYRRSQSWHTPLSRQQGQYHSRAYSREEATVLSFIDSPPTTTTTTTTKPRRTAMFSLDDPDDEHTQVEDGYVYEGPISSSPTSSNAGPVPRPSIIRRHAEGSSRDTPAQRRWTLATAMTDDRITDEVFVDEIEKMRKVTSFDGSHDSEVFVGSANDADASTTYHGFSANEPVSFAPPLLAPSTDLHLTWRRTRRATSAGGTSYTDIFEEFASAHDSTWPKALRALLTTRDLLRTEKNYLKSLAALLRSCPFGTDIPRDLLYLVQTPDAVKLPWPTTPPVAVMLLNLADLIRVSASLLVCMEEDPSVGGVATAFVLAAEQIENAFVPWCARVGTWYSRQADDSVRTRRLSRPRLPSLVTDKELPPIPTQPPETFGSEHAHSPANSMRSAPSAWRRSMPSLPLLVQPHPDPAQHSHHPQPPNTGIPVPSALFSSRQKHREYRAKVLSVRELGMMPVQRVMRYGLMFRELLKSTPTTSPNRAVVSKAAEIAERIAQRCDAVQKKLDLKNAFGSATTAAS